MAFSLFAALTAALALNPPACASSARASGRAARMRGALLQAGGGGGAELPEFEPVPLTILSGFLGAGEPPP